jgi:hypothetical protein
MLARTQWIVLNLGVLVVDPRRKGDNAIHRCTGINGSNNVMRYLRRT